MLTWDQFQWSMEVVHSRAFKGDFGLMTAGGQSVFPPMVATAGPAVSAVAGFIYYVLGHGQNDMVLIALAIIGVIPALINLLLSQGSFGGQTTS